MIDQDHVFAWSGPPNYFVATNTPTMKDVTDGDCAPNLFAVGGSTQIYELSIPIKSYFAKQLKNQVTGFPQLRLWHSGVLCRVPRTG